MVSRDRDLALKDVANLKLSKEVISKSNVELYEKLSSQKNAEQEVAIKNLQISKEKYNALEQNNHELQQKNAQCLKDMKSLVAQVTTTAIIMQ